MRFRIFHDGRKQLSLYWTIDFQCGSPRLGWNHFSSDNLRYRYSFIFIQLNLPLKAGRIHFAGRQESQVLPNVFASVDFLFQTLVGFCFPEFQKAFQSFCLFSRYIMLISQLIHLFQCVSAPSLAESPFRTPYILGIKTKEISRAIKM